MWRHRLIALPVGILITTNPPTVVGAQGQKPVPLQHVHATLNDDLRPWDRYIAQGERSGALRVRISRQDPDVLERRIERLDQYHQGVRIWGADIVRNSERGVPASIFGVVAPEITISTEPQLSAAQAAAAMMQSAGPGAALLRDPELLVLPLDSGEYRLAYKSVVSIPGSDDVAHLFVDASSGLELMRYSAIHSQSDVGTGRGVLGDLKKLSVFLQSGSFFTQDSHRPPTLLTFDMKGDLPRFKNVQAGRTGVSAGDLARDSDNVWTDPAVVDAHAHVGMAYDFYYKRFGRSGLDNRNSPIYVYTNAVSQQGALSLSTADLPYAINAFWCGPCGPNATGMLFLGNGIPPGWTSQGKNYTYFAGALDIVAHELTHGVINSSSDLIYRNESGALNEAFADMMGKSAEFFFHPPGSGVGQADYTIGKDISRAVAPGTLNGDRSMANPALFNDPDYYAQRSVGASDNGYVHTNSGIANNAFYLAIEGGTNRISRLSVQGVGAANREQVEKVFYRAFTLLMPANSTFVTARTATTQAARDLYGAGSAVERAIDQAWNAVGVPASVASFADNVSAFGQKLYSVQMTRSGNYSINLRGNNQDLDLYLVANTAACTRWPGLGSTGLPPFPTSCVIARSIYEYGVESVRAPVRSGDVLAFWVVNYSSGSAPFTIEHFIE